MTNLRLNLIAAACENMGIGYQNNLPWRLKKEMAYFTKMTSITENPEKKNVVIMGRRTWDSIPNKYRPLSNRINVVLSKSKEIKDDGVFHYKDWDEALNEIASNPIFLQVENVWIIGGSSIYDAAIKSIFCHRIYLTKIMKEFECDTFFPKFDTSKFIKIKDPNVTDEIQEEDGVQYCFEIYENKE